MQSNGGETDHPGCAGLRERKKRATREALSEAAVKLAVARGFENLRVEDIAEAAGVSPRTFNNYFPSREAAICAARVAQMKLFAGAVRARPPQEPLIDAIINAVRVDPREPDRAELRMIHGAPTLLAEFLRTVADTEAPLIEAIAQRTGTRPDEMLPRVAATAVFGALRVAMQQWLGAADPPPYHVLLCDALNQLRELSASAQATDPQRVPEPVSEPAPTTVSPVSGASARPVTMSDRAA
ncbi:TetR family transcriptional regulator [Actinocrinis puniceicyclus]|uniref:TetR family transcriptional regulator n=1 Tax=Actinocrinis puniceicyclus TaxID=977794 RepID=A0A8J8BCW3_9ACTN|nr:TetR family transcriptional regulator [Actinocrinis puniceicyclus]MBS2963516.1 TetR family transcriptional regulator [Actinocrinis puniceicyclus]